MSWPEPRFEIEGQGRQGAFVVLCDHAGNATPASLGVAPETLWTHVAFDRGALELSRDLAEALEAPLAFPTVSRLVIDCNRATDRADLIATETEFGAVPGNLDLPAAERARRIAEVHAPYHDAVSGLVQRRREMGLRPLLIGVHSFAPVLRGSARPWHVGIIFRRDAGLAASVADRLGGVMGLQVGLNVPYRPEDGVYYTLERHAERLGLPSLMLEVRDDLLETQVARRSMAERLAVAVSGAIRGAALESVAS